MTVSVVIPCYNREGILGRAIRSALAQTVPPLEIVVVDDGSTDGSADVARGFGGCVRVIEQPNGGAAAARNRGIEAARGDWIAFLDSDDEWHPEKLALQLAAAERFPETRLVFCDTVVRTESEVLIPSRFGLGGLYGMEVEQDGLFLRYDRALFTRMTAQSRVITSAVMVRRNQPGLRFPEHIWGSEDWALWLDLGLRGPFAAVDQLLVTMHQQGDNISGRKARLYRNDVKVLEELLDNPDLTAVERDEVAKELAQRRIGAAYYSLRLGETREARMQLIGIDPSQIGWAKYRVYQLASYCPGMLIRMIARLRT